MEAGQFLTIKEYALNYIENHISANQIKAGHKLPSVGKLGKMMGVSQSSVREALKILETQGKVSIHNGKGSYVTEEAEQVTISARVLESNTQKRLIEIFEIRKLLERYMIELVVANASQEQLDFLLDKMNRLMFKYNNELYTSAEDRIFHAAFYSICNNGLLRELADSVWRAFEQFYPASAIKFHATYDDTVPLHEEMVLYILEKNTAMAVAANDRVFDRILQRLTP